MSAAGNATGFAAGAACCFFSSASAISPSSSSMPAANESKGFAAAVRPNASFFEREREGETAAEASSLASFDPACSCDGRPRFLGDDFGVAAAAGVRVAGDACLELTGVLCLDAALALPPAAAA